MTDSSNAVGSSWMRDGSAAPPEERLRNAVAALTRARRTQLLVDYGFGGLLLGLALATVVVLVARLMPSPYSPLHLAVAAVIVALAVALVRGWLRRPDALDVAIRADLALRLKQRLSTAWEYMTVHDDARLAERLAAQAVKAGLPVRPRLVFPLRVNRWGRLVPVAATALLLVSTLDFTRIQAPAPRAMDERVIKEGQRLSAFGREMQARSTREKLPLSARQAEQLERLGARMEGGALSRGESLGMLRQLAKSLDEESRQALAGTDRKRIDALRSSGREGSALAPGQSPREMLERMQRGAVQSEDIRVLTQYLKDPARSGIPRNQAEEAVQRHQSGDNEGLREILEKLAQIEQALREQEELQNANAQVRRAQENLDELHAGAQGGRGMAADRDDDEGDDQEGGGAAHPNANRRLAGETRGASRYGTQSDSSVAAERQRAPILSDAEKSGQILKPRGQVREGEELVTHGQVLPKAGRPSVENVPMRAEFASQVEEVLSKEQYALHSKEFIRRYFLNLSQGAQAPQQPTQGAQ